MADETRRPWDRQPDERSRPYAAFRVFRDLGPLRTLDAVRNGFDAGARTLRTWAHRHDWWLRAVAWDDEVHMIFDRARIEELRSMHERHSQAGRVAMGKAIAALAAMQPGDIPAGAAARLLEFGSRLERSTLTVSVEELQGQARSSGPAADPWEAIALELQGTPPAAE